MIYRLNENNERVPYNVVEMTFQKGKHTTPSPAYLADPRPTRSAQMVGIVMIALIGACSIALWEIGHLIVRLVK